MLEELYESGTVQPIAFNRKIERDFSFLAVNSQLFYIYWMIYSNARHLNTGITKRFPIPPLKRITKQKTLIYEMSKNLWKNMKKFFDSIIVSYKLGIRKPHKTMFLKCLDTLNVKPSEAIFIGDKPIHDISGAKNISVKCIWMKRRDYDHVPIRPDWTVESIKQIEDIIFTELLKTI